MNKKIYLLPLLLLALVFASCEETKEVSIYDNWQERNENFNDSLRAVYDNGTLDEEGRKLERFELLSNPDNYMYYKRLSPVTETPPVDKPYNYIEGYVASDQQPLYTDTVSVYYKGNLINKQQFDGFSGADPTVFDKSFRFGVSGLMGGSGRGVIVGWTEALQRMKLGERWEIYIPWNYAYGADGNDNIPGYSTLIFDIQLFSIEDPSLKALSLLELEEE